MHVVACVIYKMEENLLNFKIIPHVASFNKAEFVLR